jgi:hypothetical protein
VPDATNDWQSTRQADVSIRRYQSSDQPAVSRLHRAGLQQMAADLGAGPWDADLDDIEAAYLDGGEFLVGVRGDEVVAMGALRRVTEATADVKRLRVREELQGRGVQAPVVPLFTLKNVDIVSQRVGNYQYNPQWHVLVDQLWVR